MPGNRSGQVDAETAATLFALLAKYRADELRSLRERHDVVAAPELRITRLLERVQGIIAFQVDLALDAHAPALLAPFPGQRPATEQILVQRDLIIARRFGSERLGLHEDAHGEIVAYEG